MRIKVVPYDPQWAESFITLRTNLEATMSDAGVEILSIEHVGSTSVPGLAAKPIIDIDIVVSRGWLAPAVAAMVASGYIHLGEMGVPDREAFRAPTDGTPRNVYGTVDGCLSLRNHLGLRDVLRSDAELRDKYGNLKLDLSRREYDNIDQYVADKSPVVHEILRVAGINPDEIEEIDAINRLD